MVRQGPLVAVVGTFVIAVLVLGCGAGGPGNNHRSGGKRSALATKEENTAPEGDRSKAQTAQEPLGLDAKVVSPLGQANLHGSVWVTSAGYGTVSRIDPQSDKVVAKIRVGRGVVDIATDESSGAVWVASAYLPKDYGGDDNPKYSEDRNLTRVDPETNRVVEEIPIEAHSQYGGAGNVAVGEGAVWVLSEDGKLLKVDPATNEIVAMVDVGHWSSHLAIYRGWVWAMVQVKEFRLVRVDPRMKHIVASEDIGPIPKIGEGGWLREGDTSGSRVGKDWHESRRKTPVSGCVRVTSLPLVSSSCIPIGRPSVGPNFGELRKTEVQLRRILLPRTWVNKAQNYTLSSDSLQDQGQIN